MTTHLPRRTVRLRLTLIYGALFLVSGAALLGITYVLVRHAAGPVLVRTTTVNGAPQTFERVPADELRAPPGLPPALQEQVERARDQAAAQREHDLNQLLVQSGFALGLMTVISLGLGWLMAGRALRPMEDAFDAQRRFVANASHELRTPLTMMRTSLDVATGKPGPLPAGMHALEGKLREGLDRADALVEDFLTLARAQHGALPAAETVSLPELVAAAVDHRRTEIGERGLEVEQDLRAADVVGSRSLLAHMIENVIDNAVRHNEDNGWIRVETQNGGNLARLIVESHGPPLDDADVRELAQPFRRLGAERTRSEDGVGLGLSIVAAVAAAHGGGLELRARPDGGLRVAIQLRAGATE